MEVVDNKVLEKRVNPCIENLNSYNVYACVFILVCVGKFVMGPRDLTILTIKWL